ncbi:MAG: aroF [Holophagaceae bacterium]|nr:aroF [Holophagaceae bacterium]
MEPTPKDSPEGLDLVRKEIDEVDRELLRLLARRFDAVRQVATTKRNEDAKAILDSARELDVQAHWVQDAEALGLSAPFARRILKEVLNHSRRIQEPLISGASEQVVHHLKVGYQGVPGCYSSLASAHLMATRTSATVDLGGYPTFPDVVDALQNREIDYAFLPVENSIGGSILDVNLPCKTSLVFKLNHHEGALAKALAILADSGTNLTRIESRPQPDTPWEYLFFVDVEGHKDSPNLSAALRQLRSCCNHLRILGSYPFRTKKQEQHLDVPTPAALPPVQPSCRIESVPETPKAAPKRTTFKIGNVTLGEGTFVMMSGPCAVESREQILESAAMVKAAGATILRGGAFKPRTSPYAFQGLGLEGLRYLQEAGRTYGMPVTTEVMAIEDILAVAAHADILQVGARNMHNFSLLKELGRLDKPILLKRGMSATVKELLLAAEYILAGGNQQVILCERGIRTFETATRSTLDVSAVPVIKRSTNLPVIVDPSHAAGIRELVAPLALAAAAAGADGLIVEAHPHPEQALCDKEQALTGEDLKQLMADLRPIVAGQGRIWS